MKTDYVDSNELSPMSCLVQAINHFVSTGDHFGEGRILHAKTGDWLVVLACNVNDEIDVEDMRKFESRFKEVIEETAIDARLEKGEEVNGCRSYLLHVHDPDMLPLAQALISAAGEAGWGSMYPYIQRYFPNLREQILAMRSS